MNERIEELVIATDAWCDQNLPSNWTDRVDEYLPVWNEKFAELIIGECAQICQTVSVEQVDNASKDYQEGREMGATVCRNQIKKHFGVK